MHKKMLIQEKLKKALRDKFENYAPEPAVMPFHTRLLGKDRLALYSFIHSLNTNFGTTIFEPVAKELGDLVHKECLLKQSAGTQITLAAQREIQSIIDGLKIAKSSPNKSEEIERIRNVARKGEVKKVKLTQIDLQVTDKSGCIYLIDIKTAKPNAGAFEGFKRTLLEWVAAMLYQNPEISIQTLIAIPYNPYAPEPYNRWTMRGMLDLDAELKVAEELWDFLGGRGSYHMLLECFEVVGVEMRDEIDAYFKRFVTN